jgi:hypothetical protein
MRNRALQILTLCLFGLLFAGCSDTSTIDNPPVSSINAPGPFPPFTFPLLDLANSIIPLPNDLLRNPTTGMLAFPGTGEPFDAANSLDGFSTSGAIIIPFRGTVRPETITNDTLPVFNSTTGEKALMSWTVSETTTGSVVTGLPVLALDPSTTYIVVTSNSIMSALSDTPILSDNAINILKTTTPLFDGAASTNPALDDATAARLEPVRVAYQPIWAAAETLTGQSRADIPLAFAFTTQTLFETLPVVRANAIAANAGLMNANPAFPGSAAAEFAPVGMGHDLLPGGFSPTAPFNNEALANGANLDFAPINIPTVERFLTQNIAPNIPSSNIGRIHLGSFQAPVYRADPVEGFWANPPVQTGTRTINFVLFLPNASSFPVVLQGVGGLPSPGPNIAQPVIFQHGITGNKFQSVAIADSLASQGLACIAIDLELHGDLSQPAPSNDSSVSGQGFINLPNLRNSRDNGLASVNNLYVLTNAIVTGQTNIDAPAIAGAPANLPELGAPIVNPAFSNPGYIGLSLGSIVGTPFHTTEPNISGSALNVGGARLSTLLLNSETFGSIVRDGLAAAGVIEGTPSFAQFFIIAQAVFDNADPVNYAAHAITGDLRGGTRARILQQGNVTDAVVPPSAQYDLARQFGNGTSTPRFTQVDPINSLEPLVATGLTDFTGSGFFEIPNAGHGTLLDPSAGPTVQVQTQAITYLGNIFAGPGAPNGDGLITSPAGIRARQISAQAAETAEQYLHTVKF